MVGSALGLGATHSELSVGSEVTSMEGSLVLGAAVGRRVGLSVGSLLGDSEGSPEGRWLGSNDGSLLGVNDGSADGR